MTPLQLTYQFIRQYYGTRRAKRSQVPLIHHIDEGLVLLQAIGADEYTQAAFCMHPYLQADTDFVTHKADPRLEQIPALVLLLTMEYRRVANSYLSTAPPSDFVGFPCEEIRQMLIADKVQNYKDFLQYHKGTHPRSDALDQYFQQWMQLLGVEYEPMAVLLSPTSKNR